MSVEARDYRERKYLSAIEAAKVLGTSVATVHDLAKRNILTPERSASGQMRFRLDAVQTLKKSVPSVANRPTTTPRPVDVIEANGTQQRIFAKDAARMDDLADGSVHLMLTSPPYFDTKLYSESPLPGDLGNIHDRDKWFEAISEVWREVFRVLQPGRKAFINIMNLPIRLEGGGYRTLNLVGRTVEVCERIGFVFKRDIVWHKTNGVRAHFGTYPYPGGILINNMHEFILEFDKPCKKGFNKYAHLTQEQKEASKLDKEFWLSVKNSDVWSLKPQGSGDRRRHVAPFPYELPYRLIKAFSYVGETVLDPFVGSGTTLLAARDLKRHGVGYEINHEIAAEAAESLRTVPPSVFLSGE